MKDRLQQVVEQALRDCYAAGALKSGIVPEFVIEVPARSDHGDFATNAAMLLAREEKQAPRKIAETLVEALGTGDGLWSRIEIAGPGFINFFLTNRCWYGVLDDVVRDGVDYGRRREKTGARVQVEFVSANPTGPLHIGHGRGAATGDAVCRILDGAGYRVQREYYVNDAGNQVTMLGRSIHARLLELQGRPAVFPEDGYRGDYVRDIARNLAVDQGDEILALDEEQAVARCSDYGIDAMLEWIEADLAAFDVRFDNWYRERSLYQRNLVDKELGELRERGLTFEADGALWLRTTDFGDDKDRVLIKADGSPTYFASDVAYHMEKFERGFDTVIDVWGADHHGYVPRMRAMLAGLGHPPEDLRVLMIQMVNLLREGQPVAMGKRSGEFVTLREVVDEVGSDACRFFFLSRRSDSQLDFDLELAKKQSNENPVYYVQYAHARVCSINRNAAEQQVAMPEPGEVDFERLDLEEELALAKMLARYPETLEGAARQLEPHRLTAYLQELAAQFHSYYNRHRVLGEDPDTSRARLYLVNAVRLVLANALELVGVSAPETM